MTRHRILLAAGLSLALLSPAIAQKQKGGGRQRLEQIATQLNLSAEQKEKLRPILQEEAGRLKAVRADQSLAKRDRRDKLQVIRKDTQEKVRPILTGEQNKKWEEIRAEARKGGKKK